MRLLLLSGLFLLSHFFCAAQSISDLNRKKLEAEKEIEYTTRLLNETQRNEKNSLGQLRLINTKTQNLLNENISKIW